MKAAFLRMLTFRIALWLERVSRRFVAIMPNTPAGKFDLVVKPRELRLEQALHAARKHDHSYEFVPQDEYFNRVEHLLKRSSTSKSA